MPHRWPDPILAIALVLLAGCGGEPDTGPVPVQWDRDSCERCRMVISDRHFAAQVRGGPGHQAYKFDDFGDAILWLATQAWKEEPGTEVWVTDFRDGQWLDARTAYYVPGQRTPMDFGLGAVAQPEPGALAFSEAVARVHQVEREKAARSPGHPPAQHH